MGVIIPPDPLSQSLSSLTVVTGAARLSGESGWSWEPGPDRGGWGREGGHSLLLREAGGVYRRQQQQQQHPPPGWR